MAKVLTDSQHYADIADAIRDKGVEGTFKPSEMPSAIASIVSGGGFEYNNYAVISQGGTYMLDISPYVSSFDEIKGLACPINMGSSASNSVVGWFFYCPQIVDVTGNCPWSNATSDFHFPIAVWRYNNSSTYWGVQMPVGEKELTVLRRDNSTSVLGIYCYQGKYIRYQQVSGPTGQIVTVPDGSIVTDSAISQSTFYYSTNNPSILYY